MIRPGHSSVTWSKRRIPFRLANSLWTSSVLGVVGCGGGPIPPDAAIVASGLNNPTDVALLGEGVVLVVESGAGRIVQVSADGGVTELVSGFAMGTFFPYDIGPLSVVVQADGTLIVGEGGGLIGRERVSFLGSDGSAAGLEPLVPISGGDFRDIVVDPTSGDLFIASASSNRIFRAAAFDGAFSEAAEFVGDTALAPIGFAHPWGLAIDAEDNLLVGFADEAGGGIVSIPLNGDGVTAPAVIYTTDRMVTGVAVRPADGVVFFAEFAAARVQDARIGRFRDGEVETYYGEVVGPSSITFGPDGELYVSMLGVTPNADGGSVVRLTPVTLSDTSDSTTGVTDDESPPSDDNANSP